MAPRLGLGLGSNRPQYVCWHNKFSLEFDGTNDNMTFESGINDVVDPDVGTISAWVKLDAVSADATIFKASTDSNNRMSIEYVNSSSKMEFIYKAGSTNKAVQVAFAFEGNDTWYHVAMTWDTTADELNAYLNGEKVGEKDSLGTWSGDIDTVKVGVNTISDAKFWHGHIDNIAVFSTVQANALLYNGGKPADLATFSGLVGYWRGDEGTGTNVEDLSINNNHGTLVNGALWVEDVA
tara:strand:- start:2821 stop:3531 length:711 start_codon:yes stop_codon:yes gene_type:complete